MRVFTRLLFILCVSGNLLGAFAQDTTPRSGFAIVTLVSGNIAGLVATESLKNLSNSGVQQAIVAPSTLATSASILAPVGSIGGNTTAIALTNPSASTGGVNLVLTDANGNVVLNTIVTLGPLGHFAGFLNDLFGTQPPALPTPLLLTVSSEIPVAILALNFRGDSFTAIPLTTLSSPTPVPVQPLNPTPTNPSTVSVGLGPTPVVVITPPVSVTTPSVTPGVTPGFGLGLPPVVAVPPPVSPPVTFVTSPVATTTTIGGPTSLVFAQIVTGGNWSTEIAVGNTSAGVQSIRIDFFSADGVNTGSLPDIIIPSKGVFFLSTAQ